MKPWSPMHSLVTRVTKGEEIRRSVISREVVGHDVVALDGAPRAFLPTQSAPPAVSLVDFFSDERPFVSTLALLVSVPVLKEPVKASNHRGSPCQIFEIGRAH